MKLTLDQWLGVFILLSAVVLTVVDHGKFVSQLFG